VVSVTRGDDEEGMAGEHKLGGSEEDGDLAFKGENSSKALAASV
jgi:hypothetical protein